MVNPYIIHKIMYEFPLDRYFYGQNFVISGLVKNSVFESVVNSTSNYFNPLVKGSKNLVILNKSISSNKFSSELLVDPFAYSGNNLSNRKISHLKNKSLDDFMCDYVLKEGQENEFYNYLLKKDYEGKKGVLVLHNLDVGNHVTALKNIMKDDLKVVMYLHCLSDLYFGSSRHMNKKHAEKFKKMRDFLSKNDVSLVAVSDAVKYSFEKLDLTNKDISVIKNGVSNSLYYPNTLDEKKTFRDAFGINADHLVGYVGRLDRVKGCDNLIEVMSRYENYNPKNVGFVLACSNGRDLKSAVEYSKNKLPGLIKDNKLKFALDLSKLMTGVTSYDFRIIETYQNFMKKLNLGNLFSLDNILTKPLQPNLDVYLHPSRSEALSLSIVEALMSSVPVVASKVGGIPELVNYLNGVLVDVKESPKENAGEYVKGIESCLKGRNEKGHLPLEFRRRLISEGYSDKKMAEKFDDFVLNLFNND